MERLSSTTSGKFDTAEKMDDKESVAALPERVSTMPYTYVQKLDYSLCSPESVPVTGACFL